MHICIEKTQYEPLVNKKHIIENELGFRKYISYTDRGEIYQTWGDVEYPVEYSYNIYGNMSAMKTYRSGTNWSSSAWPGSGETPDTTTWQYDAASGLLTNKLYADNTSVSYTYTTDGQLATRTWARTVGGGGDPALVTTYSYNSAGELTGIAYSDATPSVAFTYDRIGRQLTASSSVSSHEFAYNEYLQLVSETISTAGTTNLLTRNYDSLERPSGFSLSDPSATSYTSGYSYDAYGRFSALTSSVQSASSVVNYSYLENSDLLSGYTMGDLTVAREYEPDRNLITAIENTFGTNLISRYQYTNDELGRRTARVDSGTALSSDMTNAFGYNARLRLTNYGVACPFELTAAQMDTNGYAFSYDPIGNRESATNNADGTLSYTANALNQYTEITNGTGWDMSYDADPTSPRWLRRTGSNLTNDGVFGYVWNGENRLISVEPVSPTNGARKVDFAYDYMGRRVSKSVNQWLSNQWDEVSTTHFVYDKWNMISETINNQTSTITNHFTWGLDLSGSLQGAGGIRLHDITAGQVGGLLSAVISTNSVCYTFDANGNVSEVLDVGAGTPSSRILAHYEYSPFGETITATGPLVKENPYQFSTKYTQWIRMKYQALTEHRRQWTLQKSGFPSITHMNEKKMI